MESNYSETSRYCARESVEAREVLTALQRD
jgi:hypothetical protein